jgi:hypothetical protein
MPAKLSRRVSTTGSETVRRQSDKGAIVPEASCRTEVVPFDHPAE